MDHDNAKGIPGFGLITVLAMTRLLTLRLPQRTGASNQNIPRMVITTRLRMMDITTELRQPMPLEKNKNIRRTRC
ncbi:hypothetical protein [Aurantimonas endophytica]|uniref:Uncharacterized protein n=1 Tax=Aurantimonas endophytica TaxID=1522175 RepID=A0A7W6MPS0_9HYPH|nr:hypothetical protein [Aurantimonas endophytica]MBB4003199.1 hypothetical protein [Aurantimonas endophytica]MCO6404064.1 hypothetical protein [Aurantimonas endophytica]